MAVRIRLTRVGATKRPAYRVIAIDGRRPRDGRALEILGFYDPLTEPATVQLQTDRISAWIGKGAQPSDTVVRLMRQAEKAASSPPTEAPKRAARPKAAPKPSAKASRAAASAPTESAPGGNAEASAEADAEVSSEASSGTDVEAPMEAAPAADAGAASDPTQTESEREA